MAAPMSAWGKYLVHFAHEHLEFRIPEILSIAKLFDIDLKIPTDYNQQSPYLVVDLPSEESASKLASRALLVKSIYELWGFGQDYPSLFQTLRLLPQSLLSKHLSSETSFRVKHDSFNKQLSLQEKINLIENVLGNSGLPFEGPVNLKSPAESFHILEYYGRQDVSQAPEKPETIYFTRWITDGHRDVLKKFDLKKRKFIGNTSMDAGLALIMANMGLVRGSSFIFDPFVGTGSLLVAAAHFGGYVIGTDIDWKILHGRGRSSRAKQKWRERDENIRQSLRQYGLERCYVDVLVADTARQNMWRADCLYDAIITDPPYGVREQTKKVGTTKVDSEVADDFKEGHIPSKVTYDLSQLLVDLLNFSARHLSLGGRLVYWLPVYREHYVEENIPHHPCLELVANSEQALTTRVARRLITMEKVRDYQEDLQLASMRCDHYADASFRDKYFRPSEKNSNAKVQNVERSSEQTRQNATSEGRPVEVQRSQKESQQQVLASPKSLETS